MHFNAAPNTNPDGRKHHTERHKSYFAPRQRWCARHPLRFIDIFI